MKRSLILLAIISITSIPALAASLERELKSRWLGAWVVVSVDSYSDCHGSFTNNRINGNLVKSKGRHRLPVGELAKVHKIDAKRSRVDMHLTLTEPLLLSYQEGPFTLYREADCKIEFQVEVPRDVVRDKDVSGIEELLTMVLERHASEQEAMDSDLWNEREMEPYPEDYDRTLAELAIWRAEQANAEVQLQLDRAYDAVDRLTDRISSDPVYLTGFTEGIELAKSDELRGCPELLSIDLNARSVETRLDEGSRDGWLLIQSLELIRRLPGCFVPLPETPEE
jgi:hypothetical protein